MTYEAHRWLQFFFDLVLILWFFRTAERETAPSYPRCIAAWGALLLTLYLYLTVHEFNFPFRFLYRAALYTLYLRLSRGSSWQRSLYFACFATACLTACQNIFFTPLLYRLTRATVSFTAWPFLNAVCSNLIKFAASGLLMDAASRLAPLRNIQQPGAARWVSLTVVVVCEMYVKHSLNGLAQSGQAQTLEMSLFPIFLQLFLLAFLAFFERSLYNARVREEIRMQEVVNRCRLQNLESKQAGDADLRHLHHDMKNHLLVIRSLAAETGAPAAIDSYVGGLLHSLGRYESRVETGNALLNGLLSQKLAEAAARQISVDVILDFREIRFIGDMDLCTIFGNALDNALEACDQVPEADSRRITLRSQATAGQLLITVGNSYQGSIRMDGGLPRSGKPDAAAHGIGLRSIRRALQKYGGVMDIALDVPGWFSLTMLIPIPETPPAAS